jgi:heat shock protein HtpX
MESRSRGLALRALVALGLMAGFYLLALGVAGALLWIPYAEWTYASRIDLRIVVFCVGGAALILWSLVPRSDHFEDPGPRMTPSQQPRLFALVESVARATGQAMPVDVFLVPEVNAWVAQREGTLGFGGRRVMGLGLPLLQVLGVSELRAVLAHEFGHFHGGDTGLGSFVYQTRAAIGRTLETLEEHSSVVQLPFAWYARLFLRVSHGVSREQELAADRLAARVAGGAALATGLRKVAGTATAFAAYWASEVEPVVRAGYAPPLAEGFRRYLAAPLGAELRERVTQAAAEATDADPYDTHPPLPERLKALGAAGQTAGPLDDRAAVELLDDLARLETDLLVHATHFLGPVLTPIRWEDTGPRLYPKLWEEAAQQHQAQLAGVTVGGLAARAVGLAKAVGGAAAGQEQEEWAARLDYGTRLLGAALGSALVRAGWTIVSLPGEPIRMHRDPAAPIEPFEAVAALLRGDVGGWAERCAAAGVADLALAPAGAGGGPAAR